MRKGLVQLLFLIAVLSVIFAWIAFFTPYRHLPSIFSTFILNRNSPSPSPILTPSASPVSSGQITESANEKTYSGYGFSIQLPSNYQIEEKPQFKWVHFYFPGKEDWQETIQVSWHKTTQTNLCSLKLDGYPDAHCLKIGQLTMLDWVANNPFGPIAYIYSTINDGMLYEIQFLGIEKDKKDQILSTFKFLDQNVSPTPNPSCLPRPACLDTTPRCLLPEPPEGWCP